MDISNAAKNGDSAFLADYIRAGGNLDAQDRNGRTALMHAVDNIRIDAAITLIKAKANLDLQDKYGQTAIMLAAGRDSAALVQALIEAKADLTLISKSRLTAYGFAIDNGHSAVAKMLRKAGAEQYPPGGRARGGFPTLMFLSPPSSPRR